MSIKLSKNKTNLIITDNLSVFSIAVNKNIVKCLHSIINVPDLQSNETRTFTAGDNFKAKVDIYNISITYCADVTYKCNLLHSTYIWECIENITRQFNL
jgi:hypothetical protein